jgi:hypothetical protein
MAVLTVAVQSRCANALVFAFQIEELGSQTVAQSPEVGQCDNQEVLSSVCGMVQGCWGGGEATMLFFSL